MSPLIPMVIEQTSRRDTACGVTFRSHGLGPCDRLK